MAGEARIEKLEKAWKTGLCCLDKEVWGGLGLACGSRCLVGRRGSKAFFMTHHREGALY